jgi:hypothetical protein
MKVYFLLRVVFKGLLIGFGLPAINYIQDQKAHPGGGTYDYWDGVMIWTTAGIAISFLGWQVEKYYLRKHREKIPE